MQICGERMTQDFVYIFKKYEFYECDNTILISNDYGKVKKCFDEFPKKKGSGYVIRKYEYDKVYEGFRGGESIEWVEIDYDWTVKNIMGMR